MIRTIHRARFVVAEADHVLGNSAVHVAAPGRISRVERWTGPPAALETELIDWGDAVILPGLVNVTRTSNSPVCRDKSMPRAALPTGCAS